jgi:hypothetical protein
MDRKPSPAYLSFVHAAASDLTHPRARLLEPKTPSKAAPKTLVCVRGKNNN